MRHQAAVTLACTLVFPSLLLLACTDDPVELGDTDLATVHAPLTAADCVPSTPQGKVVICHAKGNGSFNLLTISVSGCLNGHVAHSGDVAPDCAGVCGGSATLDCAGVCNGTATADCAGTCNGTATADCAGTCNGTATADCAGTCNGTATADCAGTCNGTATADCAGTCNGTAVVDCAGTCNGTAVIDCAGTCNGTAGIDCAGTCNGTAVADCAGTCNGTAVIDCAGVCNGTAALDCAGTCNGSAATVDEVYFTTNDGVFLYSSATQAIVQLSTFPSYSIAVSTAKDIFVGTGGIEAQATGVPELVAAGVYNIDITGAATLIAPKAAEDLQFSPNGVLHVANSAGIFSIATNGTVTSRSSNPTSQFAFDSASTVVTTSGSVYSATFGFQTDRLVLDTPIETLLSGNGGEDIKVLPSGQILLCGQGAIKELLPSGAFVSFYSGMPVFNFGVTDGGNLYIGNTDFYGTANWPQGLYERPAGATIATQLDTADINALVVADGCCLPSELDCTGVCNGPAFVDCTGTCNGTAVVDCAGTCNGTAVLDCAGVCNGTAVVDCAGTCNGTAVADCEGTCNGTAALVDDVYFTTNGGVFVWSSDTASIAQISSYPSYAIAISPAGDIYVGTGGIEAQATGVPALVAAGIHHIDGAGVATLVSATAAEDLQFAPDGTLHAANSTGIYSIAANGTATSRSSNPTSQFAFDSLTTVVTTSGTIYSAIFARGTDRVFLDTPTTTLLNGDGGEDIKVLPSGQILLCGQSGIAEMLPSGAFTSVFSGMAVFNFGVTGAGTIYIGNAALYGTGSWAQGLYELTATATTTTQLSIDDINALVVVDACR